MTGQYDSLEIRDPAVREREQFAQMPTAISHAMTAPGWARHLGGADAKAINSRAALAKLPVLRKADFVAMQKEAPPFGGLNVTPVANVKRLLMSPGPIFEPEGAAGDWWGAARALFAAGFREGDIVHNSFAYHLTPGGFIMESGAHALGCAVIPGGVGNTEQQLEAIAHYRPTGYVGTPDFLKILLDTAEKSGKDASSLKRGLVSGAALPASLREELGRRGVAVLQCYATAELGVIAYESEAREGMIVNETVIVEIVRPGTGDLSALMTGVSPCGRTNARIKGWMGRADQTAKVKGMFVHPKQIAEVAARHPELKRVRLVVDREAEQDTMTLLAECAPADAAFATAIAATLQSITKLKGSVKLMTPGTLPNDGKLIADERKP